MSVRQHRGESQNTGGWVGQTSPNSYRYAGKLSTKPSEQSTTRTKHSRAKLEPIVAAIEIC